MLLIFSAKGEFKILYLKSFVFPDGDTEAGVISGVLTKWHNTVYPFKVASGRILNKLAFSPITILYGSNGCGKTTLLNIMAEKLGVERGALYNKSSFFNQYLELCSYSLKCEELPKSSRIITSDDVFDFMLKERMLNNGIDDRREELIKEYLEYKAKDKGQFRYREAEDFNELSKIIEVRNKTLSMYVKTNIGLNIREKSNGENAIRFFMERITEDGLFFLDEPENSLAPERQLELAQFLEEAVRFYRCQIVMATHSPFLAAMKDAVVYDLDSRPAQIRNWYDLQGIKLYLKFFEENRRYFE